MSNNKLYTLQKLMQDGVHGQPISSIVIPKIQRAYAQGRVEEVQVRDSILTEIFASMENKQVAEFSFIYGSINKGGSFELLDGQQRITTLFLIHIYIYLKEKQSIPEWLHHFTYETRTSSSDFIRKLMSLTFLGEEDELPSHYLTQKLWFTNSYKVDSTVQSMLVMLDHIHEKYTASGAISCCENLSYLQFYVLPLDKFGLTEELYIKMNARGLSLTPFENFKADLVGYYKPTKEEETDENLEDWLSFATQLDTTWIDLFWNKEDESDDVFNNKFFRFIYRYASILVYTDLKSSVDARSFAGDKDPDLTFFEQISERQSDKDERYAGFSGYEKLLTEGVDLKGQLTKLLDCFYEHKALIKKQLIAPWGDHCDILGEAKSYTRKNAVIYAAILCYILNYDEFNEENFKKWMRVAWNIVENTNIDGIVPQINTIRSLKSILKKDSLNRNIYKTLKDDFLTNYPQAITEEARKAMLIEEDFNYEELFMNLEKHEFFRGFIDTIIPESSISDITIEKMKQRATHFSYLFNKEGITETYRNEHILIRAIVASIHQWDGGLNGLIITEKVDSDAHLKALLRRDEVKRFIQHLFDDPQFNPKSPYETINDMLNNYSFTDFMAYEDREKELMERVYNRLCSDIRLYDWIYEHCTTSQSVVIKERDGRFKVRVPRKWYDKVYLDNTLASYIPSFIKENKGYYYLDENQEEMFNDYGFYFGDAITIGTTIKEHQLLIDFNFDERARFAIRSNIPHLKEAIMSQWENAIFSEDSSWVWIQETSLEEAKSMADEISSIIKSSDLF